MAQCLLLRGKLKCASKGETASLSEVMRLLHMTSVLEGHREVTKVHCCSLVTSVEPQCAPFS